jgi:hypothetical protein
MSHHRMSAGSISRPAGLFVFVVVLALGVLLLGTIGQIGQAHASGSEPPLLPNLVADPPDNVSLETSQHEGGLSGKKVTPELLLRFNGYIHNDGSGALDVRGEREAPKVSRETEKEVEGLSESKPELSSKAEAELASPPMKVFQRLYTTNAGNPEESEKYLERPHETPASSAEMFYVNADGHHHWHLQHVAKYSLWNSEKTAEVAPAEKVGFCLEDSEHVETSKGPSTPVYADNVPPYRRFCRQFEPNATNVYEGISPGWRDAYTWNLGFQWVDASNVLPGEYWLREEVNPNKVIMEEGVGNKVAYAKESTIIPGFDALAQTTGTGFGQPVILALDSKSWEDSATPTYTIVSQPTHGTLGKNGNQVTYTPEAGYSGLDSFTFSAADPNSEFPRNPAVATVSIDVGEGQLQPSVAIEGAPSSMIAGTSVQLSAKVANDGPNVTWEANAGTITPGGLYTAPSEPPPGGTVLVTARSEKGASDQRTIAILPVPPPVAEPAASEEASPSTLSGGISPGGPSSPSIGVSRPQAMLIGHELIMTTKVTEVGRVRLSAYLGKHRLGTCVTQTAANRTFTCRLTLGKRIPLDARISVLASLRIGRLILRQLRPAARVQEMKMKGGAELVPGLHLVGERELSGQLLCGPEFASA